MSDTDSFIDEVSEEVRRDKLYTAMRRYGWIAVVAVVAVVGAAAYNEWRKANERTAAQAFGDAILAAEGIEDPQERNAALNGIAREGEQSAVLNLLVAGGETTPSSEALKQIAADASLPDHFRHLAMLRLAQAQDQTATLDDVRTLLAPVVVAGGPYRVLGEEALALAELRAGDQDAAVTRLQALLLDDEASQALRRRATQLIVALGGTPEAS
ncbi:hypothetical protein SAMN04488030_1627 [Aliiroseovarius halocynthiae]|uniref:Tetratricopeptide repeat protein n=1 Tax=Aliiroseovarius halocynthiae TaxID=985055 RepID=A0A545SWZ0_9RHOB|nr:hypothetical protein [Aliiroseovarius halocynthiae]TQV69482.1 hypothetical protein FIL88_08040 [Aliiroseovarius halocynthiae]SMR72882.1 hypothetical protein SAMN04488030_1627 [Aliiroseovarius halocynthiae]